jgi:ribosomal protein L37AE/L43A
MMNSAQENLLRSNGLQFNKDFCPICRRASLRILNDQIICTACYTKFQTGYASTTQIPQFRDPLTRKEKKLIRKMPQWEEKK